MSGQSVLDRVTAAKHTITGSDLAKSVCKATTAEVMGPKKKHLDCKLGSSIHGQNLALTVAIYVKFVHLCCKNYVGKQAKSKSEHFTSYLLVMSDAQNTNKWVEIREKTLTYDSLFVGLGSLYFIIRYTTV